MVYFSSETPAWNLPWLRDFLNATRRLSPTSTPIVMMNTALQMVSIISKFSNSDQKMPPSYFADLMQQCFNLMSLSESGFSNASNNIPKMTWNHSFQNHPKASHWTFMILIGSKISWGSRGSMWPILASLLSYLTCLNHFWENRSHFRLYATNQVSTGTWLCSELWQIWLAMSFL